MDFSRKRIHLEQLAQKSLGLKWYQHTHTHYPEYHWTTVPVVAGLHPYFTFDRLGNRVMRQSFSPSVLA